MQSGQANESASIIVQAKKRNFANSEMLEAQHAAKQECRNYQTSLRV